MQIDDMFFNYLLGKQKKRLIDNIATILIYQLMFLLI